MSNDQHILKSFDALVTALNDTKGTNEKLVLLQKHQDLKPLIKRIWDPDTKTGVTKKGLEDFAEKGKNLYTFPSAPTTLYDLIDMLCAKTLTGDKAKTAVWLYIARYEKYEDLILRIVEKKPRIRLGETLLLKAFPGIFTIFRVCLAQEFTPQDFEREFKIAQQTAWISKKIDGVRTICCIKKNIIKFYSRTGNEWTSLDKLRSDIKDHIHPWMTDEELQMGVCFDGEIVALDSEGRENFSETVSQSRKKDIQMVNPRYMIFDMIPMPTFEQQEVGPILKDRLAKLVDLFANEKTAHCEVLQQTQYTADAFTKLSEQAKHESWEGLMVRFNSTYEAKRTNRLLKYKFFITEEFTVTVVTIEDMPFANDSGGETLKRAVKNVTIMYKGNPVNVGSGFSAAERLDFAKHPEKIKGKMISVTYQEETKDKKTGLASLRCPIFKLLIGDKRDF